MKKKIFKFCVSILCATTMFIGGYSTNVNAQTNGDVFSNESGYTYNLSVKDKKVVKVRLKPMYHEVVKGDIRSTYDVYNLFGYCLEGTNKDEEVVWSKNLYQNNYVEQSIHGNSLATYGNHDDNSNYYIRYDNKIYAFNRQTGKLKWISNISNMSNLSKTNYSPESSADWIDFIEVKDKLVILDNDEKFYNVYILDLKTGRFLKKAENILENYFPKEAFQEAHPGIELATDAEINELRHDESYYGKSFYVVVITPVNYSSKNAVLSLDFYIRENRIDNRGLVSSKGVTGSHGYCIIDTENYTIKFEKHK